MTLAYTRASPAVAWALVAVWTAVVVALSLVSLNESVRLLPEGGDKIVHAVFYAVLAILTSRALAASGVGEWAAAVGAFTGALALGGGIEWIQGYVGRSSEVLDWLADGVGAMAGLVLRHAWNLAGVRS